jgi:FSR family fosmidomycin resistance protein-like MFS transporter
MGTTSASLEARTAAAPLASNSVVESTTYRMLISISIVHLLNDSLQSVIPGVLPILQSNLALSYTQVGMILFVMNVTASVFQPFVGIFTDRKPRPFLLPAGLTASGIGMAGIALSDTYWMLLLSVALVGLGSAVFHPEASRVAYMAAGAKRGLGQSIFQVGGNSGQALAPLLTILVFVPLGQGGAMWFTLIALLATAILVYIAFWYRGQSYRWQKKGSGTVVLTNQKKRFIALALLVLLVSYRSWIYSGLNSFYPLYLIDIKGFSIEGAQLYVFALLAAGALGTLLGGSLADRFGKWNVLVFSMVGVLPFTLLLPYAGEMVSYFLLAMIGFILFSSFSVSVIYAQDLWPGKIGTVSGLIIGLAFGMGGIGASVLGLLADWKGLYFVILFCSVISILGLISLFLPKDQQIKEW